MLAHKFALNANRCVKTPTLGPLMSSGCKAYKQPLLSSSTTRSSISSTATGMSKNLVNAEDLLRRARDSETNVAFVDGSWYLNSPTRNGRQEYLQKRLPGAVFFDIDEISDKTQGLPHMLPSESRFAKAMSDFGIGNTTDVVIYTGKSCFSAARVWWTFKVFGHHNVSILDGGLEAWATAGGPVDTQSPAHSTPRTQPYTPSFKKEMVADWKKVQLLAKKEKNGLVLDARSAGRFRGSEPEPRPGLRGGHIPGSKNIPFGLLLDKEFSKFQPREILQKVFDEAGVETDSPDLMVTSCGSGVTASVITFALHLLGRPLERTPVYDGSWSEWGGLSDADAPVIKS